MDFERRPVGAKDSHTHADPSCTLESSFTACGDPLKSSCGVSLTILSSLATRASIGLGPAGRPFWGCGAVQLDVADISAGPS
ncbi:MAG: hypothetical protein CMN98_04220 [Synechococcus sp. NP17]|nr:hypothetical protein [Synechococcus sp. NP17]